MYFTLIFSATLSYRSQVTEHFGWQCEIVLLGRNRPREPAKAICRRYVQKIGVTSSCLRSWWIRPFALGCSLLFKLASNLDGLPN